MKTNFSPDQLRIASPCRVGWEGMAGDDRVRFCDQCSLNVYNISSMSEREIRTLVETTEGRICGRIYRRADGTLLTQDCPVGCKLSANALHGEPARLSPLY